MKAEVWTRMPDERKRTGIRIRFSSDKVTRAVIVDGVVVEESDVTADYRRTEAGWEPYTNPSV